MTHPETIDLYGTLTEPATLTLKRLLPGPVDRVWTYLTQSDLRRQWLASGTMDLAVGSPFTLTWRNDELSDPPGRRPEGFGAEHSMPSHITEFVPLRRLSFAWQGTGDVTFELEPQGRDVLLTVTHRRLPERSMMLKVSAGWHMHLDVLAVRLAGGRPASFWDGWHRLMQDYDRRLPA